MADERREVLTGILGRVKWHENGYLIAEVEVEPEEEPGGAKARLPWTASVKGNCLAPQVGARYVFQGAWVQDGKWGSTFRFDEYEVALPTEVGAIRDYLLRAKWIGPKVAETIVAAYGESTLEVLKDEPERVAAMISGITLERAESIAEDLRANEANEKVQVGLNALFAGTGIGKALAGRVVRKWGKHSLEVATADPFALTEIEGIGFLLADNVRKKLGIPYDDPSRLRAGILYVLKEAAWGDGHTHVPETDLLARAGKALSVGAAMIVGRLREMADDGEVVILDGAGGSFLGTWRTSLRRLHDDERFVAGHVRALLAFPRPEVEMGPVPFGLADDQREAWLRILQHGVFVLNGCPGTGKTTLLRFVVDACVGQRVVLAAPTGKAAKRITEQTLRPASTIHRLLEPEMVHGKFVFTRNADRPLEADVVIIDEASMVDVNLAARLLEAVPLGSRVIFVGDVHQLPSVGPGNVLRDLIASGMVPTAELTIIKRQEEGARIVKHCHEIKAGRTPVLDNDGARDFFWIDEDDDEAAAATIVDLVSRRLPAFYGADPNREIQVLAPMKEKGAVSCKRLNEELRKVLNPAAADQKRFGLGDRVIQTKNEYGLGIINGDVGTVIGVDLQLKEWTVRFEDPEREVPIPFANHDLELAWALSVHKFQGSEARIVVIPVHRSQASVLMQRNLLYTAISRAREVCVIVGQRGEVPKIVKRQDNLRRWTNLQGFLREP